MKAAMLCWKMFENVLRADPAWKHWWLLTMMATMMFLAGPPF